MSAFARQRSPQSRSPLHLYAGHFSGVADGWGRDGPRNTESIGRQYGRKISRKYYGGIITEMEDSAGPDSPLSAWSADLSAADAWAQCSLAMKEHRAARIKAWKEEIDAELVFAALFSAILTAFDVEVYKLLLPADSNGNSSTIDQSAAEVINALWFAGLISSLAASSICILVRQWLNQCTTGLASVSPEIARVRQFRQDNLRKWKVAEIMMLIPILLQGAVVLFLIGLVLFLKQLNRTVMTVASVLVASLLFFLVITTILPTIQDGCSYQSPQAWGFFAIFQAIKRPVRSVCRTISAHATRWAMSREEGYFNRLRTRYAKLLVQKLTRFANKTNTYSWVGRERILVEASGPLLDQHLLVESDATFLGDNFLRNIIRPCLNDMSPETAIKSYYDIMEHRADRIENGVHYFDTRGDRAESVAILADLTLDTLVKTRAASSSDALRDHAIRIMRILEPLLVRALPLTYDHFCRVFFALSGDKDRKVRHYAFSILYQQLWRNLALADQYSSTGCHDLAALVTFISRVRQDDDLKHFLDACDLVICLATLPSLPLSDYSAIREALQGTLLHLKSFFETPLWHHDPLLFYSLERIADHLVTLEKKYPQALTDDFLDVLGDVIDKAPQLNVNGDWEDKLRKLQTSFTELRTLRQDARSAPDSSSGRPPLGQRHGPVFPMPDI